MSGLEALTCSLRVCGDRFAEVHRVRKSAYLRGLRAARFTGVHGRYCRTTVETALRGLGGRSPGPYSPNCRVVEVFSETEFPVSDLGSWPRKSSKTGRGRLARWSTTLLFVVTFVCDFPLTLW